MKTFLLSLFILFPCFVANAGALDDAKSIQSASNLAAQQDSATVAKAVAGCGFDYQCDANGVKIPGTEKSKPVLETSSMDIGASKNIEAKQPSGVEQASNGETSQPENVAGEGHMRGFTGHAHPEPKKKPVKQNKKIATALDPFAADASLDKAYTSAPASVEEGFVAYTGGTSEEALMATAAANKKAARIEAEKQAAEAEAAEMNMIVGAFTDTMMNVAINEVAPPKKQQVVTESVNQPTVYYHRDYASETYQQPHSSILEGAKGMTGGGSKGWY